MSQKTQIKLLDFPEELLDLIIQFLVTSTNDFKSHWREEDKEKSEIKKASSSLKLCCKAFEALVWCHYSDKLSIYVSNKIGIRCLRHMRKLVHLNIIFPSSSDDEYSHSYRGYFQYIIKVLTRENGVKSFFQSLPRLKTLRLMAAESTRDMIDSSRDDDSNQNRMISNDDGPGDDKWLNKKFQEGIDLSVLGDVPSDFELQISHIPISSFPSGLTRVLLNDYSSFLPEYPSSNLSVFPNLRGLSNLNSLKKLDIVSMNNKKSLINHGHNRPCYISLNSASTCYTNLLMNKNIFERKDNVSHPHTSKRFCDSSLGCGNVFCWECIDLIDKRVDFGSYSLTRKFLQRQTDEVPLQNSKPFKECGRCTRIVCNQCSNNDFLDQEEEGIDKCTHCLKTYCKQGCQRWKFCYSCEDLVCEDCTKLGRVCSRCEEFFCPQRLEYIYECEICNVTICDSCEDETFDEYINNSFEKCFYCNRQFCSDCSPLNFYNCKICETHCCPMCYLLSSKTERICSFCELFVCEDCSHFCEMCERRYCTDCEYPTGECDFCLGFGGSYCNECNPILICSGCGDRKICQQCDDIHDLISDNNLCEECEFMRTLEKDSMDCDDEESGEVHRCSSCLKMNMDECYHWNQCEHCLSAYYFDCAASVTMCDFCFYSCAKDCLEKNKVRQCSLCFYSVCEDCSLENEFPISICSECGKMLCSECSVSCNECCGNWCFDSCSEVFKKPCGCFGCFKCNKKDSFSFETFCSHCEQLITCFQCAQIICDHCPNENFCCFDCVDNYIHCDSCDYSVSLKCNENLNLIVKCEICSFNFCLECKKKDQCMESRLFHVAHKYASTDSKSAFFIATCYENGSGVKQSLVKAIYWLRKCKAMDQNDHDHNTVVNTKLMELIDKITSRCSNCFKEIDDISITCERCSSCVYCSYPCLFAHLYRFDDDGHLNECNKP